MNGSPNYVPVIFEDLGKIKYWLEHNDFPHCNPSKFLSMKKLKVQWLGKTISWELTSTWQAVVMICCSRNKTWLHRVITLLISTRINWFTGKRNVRLLSCLPSSIQVMEITHLKRKAIHFITTYKVNSPRDIIHLTFALCKSFTLLSANNNIYSIKGVCFPLQNNPSHSIVLQNWLTLPESYSNEGGSGVL